MERFAQEKVGVANEGKVGGFFAFSDMVDGPREQGRKGSTLKGLGALSGKEKSVVFEEVPRYEEECETTAGKLDERDIQMVGLLVASGISLEVVAERTSFTIEDLAKICSSLRFEAVLQELQRTLLVDASSGLLHSQKLASIRMLSLVRDDPATMHKDRISAAKTLLQMSFDVKNSPVESPTLNSIEAEQAEIKRLLQDPMMKHLLK